MKKSIILVFIEFTSSSGLGSFLLLLFSLILLLGGILTSFDWFVFITPFYFKFPNILYLISLFALLFLISYFSFLKKSTYFIVMSNIALLTIILIFVGNRLLGLFFGTHEMRPYFLDNVILYLGYIFYCIFIGILISATISFISLLLAKGKLKTMQKT